MKKIITRFCTLLLMATILVSPVLASFPSEPANAASVSNEPDPRTVNAAIKEFNALSKQDRKARIKEAKKVIKQYKADKKAGKAEGETSKVLLVILAIILPPLAVYLHQGEINSKFWISLVLTILFFVPGVIYSLLVVLDVI